MAFAQWLTILTVGLFATLCSAAVELDGNGQSFSSVIKQYHYDTPGNELTLFERKFDSAGYVTEQWFTGGPFDQYARIRIYLDGEDEASLDFNVTLTEAVDETSDNYKKPWSSRLFGHLASGGGYFNLFRIPFLSHIKITLTNDVTTGYLW
jgi:hypothetical protein